MRINELKDQFLHYLVEYRGRSINTRIAYDFDLTKFIHYLDSRGVHNPDEVTAKEIESYLLSYLNMSAVTKARIRSSIKSFFSFLSRKELVKTNPASNLESMKLPEKTPEFLTQEQCQTFLETIIRYSTPYYKERDLTLIKLLMRTGLRRAEIVGLNMNDIDFSKNTLRVRRKGNREVFLTLHNQLVGDLKKYIQNRKAKDNEPLFISKRGSRLSPSEIWHLVKSYSQKAGLNGKVTVHSLRHTFATTLLSKGMPLPYIQELMGHRSSQTTARYLHLRNFELIEAFNKIVFEERGDM